MQTVCTRICIVRILMTGVLTAGKRAFIDIIIPTNRLGSFLGMHLVPIMGSGHDHGYGVQAASSRHDHHFTCT